MQAALLDFCQSLVDCILLVDRVDQFGLVVLLSNAPEVSNQVKGTITIARPAKIILAFENSNEVGTNPLTVVATNISFRLDGDTQVTERSLQDLGVGDFGPQSAKVRHLDFLQ